jgi:hypothetical protein
MFPLESYDYPMLSTYDFMHFFFFFLPFEFFVLEANQVIILLGRNLMISRKK